jgi:L-serine dehydratase
MRGPSSSHTAAAYRLGCYVRSLASELPKQVGIIFREGQTYALTFRQQGADLAFAAGLQKLDLRSTQYDQALELAVQSGLKLYFTASDLKWASHPNDLLIQVNEPGNKEVEGLREGKDLIEGKVRGNREGSREGVWPGTMEGFSLKAASVGGGSIRITGLNDWSLESSAETYDLFLEGPAEALAAVKSQLPLNLSCSLKNKSGRFFLQTALMERPESTWLKSLKATYGLKLWLSEPVAFVCRGSSLFHGAEGALAYCRSHSLTLAQAGFRYEAELLGLSEKTILAELTKVADVMLDSVEKGLAGEGRGLKFLTPSAQKILGAKSKGQLPLNGPQTLAAVNAMATMEINSSGGLVCAAPTAGSAGIMPGVLATLKERLSLSSESLLEALMAGGVVGLVYDQGATFAAEIAGCQVEVGASAAMAAGSAVHAARGTPEQIFQAAGLMLQNYMGLVCDPVQGYVEMPCLIRNALAASTALTAADLVLGGYQDPVPFDQAVAAVLETGRLLPLELRCTSLGGMAICPGLIHLNPKNCS